MTAIASFIEALNIVLSWPVIGFVILGIVLGIVIGGVPGLGATVGMALILPLTFPIDGISAIVLLIGIYNGSVWAGSIASILFNTPGSGSGAAATLDGYPMARAGRATEAISATAAASAIGGSFGVLVLFFLAPHLLAVLKLFTSPEYFLVAILGLTLISIVAQGALLKGILAGCMGILITTIGISPTGGETRFVPDITLIGGINFVAIILGVFALGEMYSLSRRTGSLADTDVSIGVGGIKGLVETIKRPITVGKSGLIGVFVGAVPGAGATIATFVAYAEAVRSSANSESFGKGDIRGVISVDSASNGTVSGALIPTLAFGIPGGAATAVLLGGLIMHGLRPGPGLLSTDLHITYSILLAVLVGNVVILVVGVLLVSKLGIVTKLDTNLIIPVIVVIAFTAAFVLRNNWVDPITVLLMGVIGYYMKVYNYSIIAFLLGAILGPIAEVYFIRAVTISDYSVFTFVSSPLSILLVLLIIGSLAVPFTKDRVRNSN